MHLWEIFICRKFAKNCMENFKHIYKLYKMSSKSSNKASAIASSNLEKEKFFHVLLWYVYLNFTNVLVGNFQPQKLCLGKHLIKKFKKVSDFLLRCSLGDLAIDKLNSHTITCYSCQSLAFFACAFIALILHWHSYHNM